MDQSADGQRDFDAFVMSAKGETSTKSFQDWAGGEQVTLAIVFTDVVGSPAEAGNPLIRPSGTFSPKEKESTVLDKRAPPLQTVRSNLRRSSINPLLGERAG